MRLKDHIRKKFIFPHLKPKDKADLFQVLARHMGGFFPTMDASELLSSLEEREAQTTTGIGQGVAIPHARVKGLEDTVCALAQIPGGLEFNAVDDEKVTCVFLLISPVDAVGRHIKLLARIARLASNPTFIDQLNRAETADEIHQLLKEEDARHVN